MIGADIELCPQLLSTTDDSTRSLLNRSDFRRFARGQNKTALRENDGWMSVAERERSLRRKYVYNKHS